MFHYGEDGAGLSSYPCWLVLLSVKAGTALVDSAAAQAIMGMPSLCQLEQYLLGLGLRAVWVPRQ
eukprot:2810890-Pyramimonas_sp.AAC.1